MNILITGGTVFVSRYTADYFSKRGHRVFVLNRGSRPQPDGVTPILADRHALGDTLRSIHFDAVLDITAYTAEDVNDLLDGLGSFSDYILVSSSAVYPETNPQPFTEDQPCGPNIHWGAYGLGKLAAEAALLSRVPHAYVLRPPYLYGPGENIYRSPYVFECAESGRPFPIPGDGKMGLQFFHVEDLCRFMEILLVRHPGEHIYNVGNTETVSIAEWVRLCYDAVYMPLSTVTVGPEHPRWAYFPFRDYAYRLDTAKQAALMPELKPLANGLREEYEWFREHRGEVSRKRYLGYIDEHLISSSSTKAGL